MPECAGEQHKELLYVLFSAPHILFRFVLCTF